MVNDFIFELGCEELPSGAVLPLASAFAQHMVDSLEKAQLAHGPIKIFASPRRIALFIKSLEVEQKAQKITRKGPAFIAAYDKEGKPTQALLGFAKSCATEVDRLSKIETDKGAWMIYEMESAGKKTSALLPDMVRQSLSNLPIAKPMRWGDKDDEFARPVHWAVMLLGDEVIETPILGIISSNTSRGHRFHHPDTVVIQSPEGYESQMREAFVIADFAQRKRMIQEQVQSLAEKQGAIAIMPDELIDEVTSIVEWPQALLANFQASFLEVPAEALIASMQSHQKCFALKDHEGHLLPYFITVANISSADPKQVIAGNEKVMRARLSDAAFFFSQDKKQALSQHIPATERVIFQAKLGSLQDKASRVAALMQYLAKALALDEVKALRAAALSKCDLMTGMVGEFPELQGLMGYYYAMHDGEEQEVAAALNEQYMPRFAADAIPSTQLGLALSLADRLDTLVGIFAIGQKPSGVKDPFKLRRHALAVVRMLASIPQPLNLSTLLSEAAAQYAAFLPVEAALLTEIKAFILDRSQSFYQSQGIANELVLAVRACQDDWIFDADKRIRALQTFVTMPEAASLSAACKRVTNLLNQAVASSRSLVLDESLLQEKAEAQLLQSIKSVSVRIESLYGHAEYGLVLQELAGLKEAVDAFFDSVMVMVDDALIKQNRLALLARLQELLQGVADISLLQLS